MSDFNDFFVHTVTVRTLTGAGGMGQTFAAAVTKTVFADDKRRLVRGPNAEQVISESSVYGDVADAGAFTPGSEVDLPSGRTAVVIVCAVKTSGTLGLPDHFEAACT